MSSSLSSTSYISSPYARPKVAYEWKMDAIHRPAFRPLRAPRRSLAPQSSLRNEVGVEVVQVINADEVPSEKAAPSKVASTSKDSTDDNRVREVLWKRAAHKKNKGTWLAKRHEARLEAWRQSLIAQVDIEYEAYGAYLDSAQYHSDCERMISCSEHLEYLRIRHLKTLEFDTEFAGVSSTPTLSSRFVSTDIPSPTKKEWRDFAPAYRWDYEEYVDTNGIPDSLQALEDLMLKDNCASLHNLYLVQARSRFMGGQSDESENEMDSEGISDIGHRFSSGSVPSTPESGSEGLKLPDEGRFGYALERWSSAQDVGEGDEDDDSNEYVPIIMEREDVSNNRDRYDEDKGEEFARFGDEGILDGF